MADPELEPPPLLRPPPIPKDSDPYIHSLWMRKIFWGALTLWVIGWSVFLATSVKGGFSETHDPAAIALEAVVFGNMIFTPYAAAAILVGCLVGKAAHLASARRRRMLGTETEPDSQRDSRD